MDVCPERNSNKRTDWSLPPPSTMIRTARPISLVPRSFKQRRWITNAPPQTFSQSHGHLPTSQSPIVSKLHFFNSVTGNGTQIPTYRVIDGEGRLLDGAELPEVRFSPFNSYIIHKFIDRRNIRSENVRPELGNCTSTKSELICPALDTRICF